MKTFKITWEELHSTIIKAKNKEEAERLWREEDDANSYVEVSWQETEEIKE